MEDLEKYIDRELSWLDFNERVLGEALDEKNPLLERLKFLGIVSSNLDEFFMVRVAGLRPSDLIYSKVYTKAFMLMNRQNRYFMDHIVEALDDADIVRAKPDELNAVDLSFLEKIFKNDLMPLLTPIALRDDSDLSLLINLGLYQIYELASESEDLKIAVVEIPKTYPRMIRMPSTRGRKFILGEDLISIFAEQLFTGYNIKAKGLLRVTRAMDLSVDDENDQDYAEVITEALRAVRQNHVVRLEVAASNSIVNFLKEKLQLSDERIFRHTGWFELQSIASLAFEPGFDHLKREVWNSQHVVELEQRDDIWSLLKEKDMLVHQPYESFDAFLHFLKQASTDSDVLAIKMTLYRTANPSAVVKHLEHAIECGKRVTVLVELKARFDEKRNVEWAKRLVDAGATVLYGVARLKTHSKACLVVRREAEGIKRYVHLSTGNYNEKTAQIYSDLSFFSAREDLTSDIAAFFNVITGYSQPIDFLKIAMAPFGLRRKFERLTMREAMRSNKKVSGLIMAKMNSLVDQRMIDALYKASQAGVKILLNVRGICCLKPGVEGLSENIEVVSVVDMFLEHSRIFYFYNGGEEDVYLSSADWMPRNFDRRIELMFPIEDAQMKNEIKNMLLMYFKDNQKSWILTRGGKYEKKKDDVVPFQVQKYFCENAFKKNSAKRVSPLDIKPKFPQKEIKKSPDIQTTHLATEKKKTIKIISQEEDQNSAKESHS